MQKKKKTNVKKKKPIRESLDIQHMDQMDPYQFDGTTGSYPQMMQQQFYPDFNNQQLLNNALNQEPEFDLSTMNLADFNLPDENMAAALIQQSEQLMSLGIKMGQQAKEINYRQEQPQINQRQGRPERAQINSFKKPPIDTQAIPIKLSKYDRNQQDLRIQTGSPRMAKDQLEKARQNSEKRMSENCSSPQFNNFGVQEIDNLDHNENRPLEPVMVEGQMKISNLRLGEQSISENIDTPGAFNSRSSMPFSVAGQRPVTAREESDYNTFIVPARASVGESEHATNTSRVEEEEKEEVIQIKTKQVTAFTLVTKSAQQQPRIVMGSQNLPNEPNSGLVTDSELAEEEMKVGVTLTPKATPMSRLNDSSRGSSRGNVSLAVNEKPKSKQPSSGETPSIPEGGDKSTKNNEAMKRISSLDRVDQEEEKKDTGNFQRKATLSFAQIDGQTQVVDLNASISATSSSQENDIKPQTSKELFQVKEDIKFKKSKTQYQKKVPDNDAWVHLDVKKNTRPYQSSAGNTFSGSNAGSPSGRTAQAPTVKEINAKQGDGSPAVNAPDPLSIQSSNRDNNKFGQQFKFIDGPKNSKPRHSEQSLETPYMFNQLPDDSPLEKVIEIGLCQPIFQVMNIFGEQNIQLFTRNDEPILSYLTKELNAQEYAINLEEPEFVIKSKVSKTYQQEQSEEEEDEKYLTVTPSFELKNATLNDDLLTPKNLNALAPSFNSFQASSDHQSTENKQSSPRLDMEGPSKNIADEVFKVTAFEKKFQEIAEFEVVYIQPVYERINLEDSRDEEQYIHQVEPQIDFEKSSENQDCGEVQKNQIDNQQQSDHQKEVQDVQSNQNLKITIPKINTEALDSHRFQETQSPVWIFDTKEQLTDQKQIFETIEEDKDFVLSMISDNLQQSGPFTTLKRFQMKNQQVKPFLPERNLCFNQQQAKEKLQDNKMLLLNEFCHQNYSQRLDTFQQNKYLRQINERNSNSSFEEEENGPETDHEFNEDGQIVYNCKDDQVSMREGKQLRTFTKQQLLFDILEPTFSNSALDPSHQEYAQVIKQIDTSEWIKLPKNKKKLIAKELMQRKLAEKFSLNSLMQPTLGIKKVDSAVTFQADGKKKFLNKQVNQVKSDERDLSFAGSPQNSSSLARLKEKDGRKLKHTKTIEIDNDSLTLSIPLIKNKNKRLTSPRYLSSLQLEKIDKSKGERSSEKNSKRSTIKSARKQKEGQNSQVSFDQLAFENQSQSQSRSQTMTEPQSDDNSEQESLTEEDEDYQDDEDQEINQEKLDALLLEDEQENSQIEESFEEEESKLQCFNIELEKLADLELEYMNSKVMKNNNIKLVEFKRNNKFNYAMVDIHLTIKQLNNQFHQKKKIRIANEYDDENSSEEEEKQATEFKLNVPLAQKELLNALYDCFNEDLEYIYDKRRHNILINMSEKFKSIKTNFFKKLMSKNSPTISDVASEFSINQSIIGGLKMQRNQSQLHKKKSGVEHKKESAHPTHDFLKYWDLLNQTVLDVDYLPHQSKSLGKKQIHQKLFSRLATNLSSNFSGGKNRLQRRLSIKTNTLQDESSISSQYKQPSLDPIGEESHTPTLKLKTFLMDKIPEEQSNSSKRIDDPGDSPDIMSQFKLLELNADLDKIEANFNDLQLNQQLHNIRVTTHKYLRVCHLKSMSNSKFFHQEENCYIYYLIDRILFTIDKSFFGHLMSKKLNRWEDYYIRTYPKKCNQEKDRITVMPLGFDNLQFQMNQTYNIPFIVKMILIAQHPIRDGIKKLIFQKSFSRLVSIIENSGLFSKDILLIKFSELYIMSCIRDDTYKYNINKDCIESTTQQDKIKTASQKSTILADLFNPKSKSEEIYGLVKNLYVTDEDKFSRRKALPLSENFKEYEYRKKFDLKYELKDLLKMDSELLCVVFEGESKHQKKHEIMNESFINEEEIDDNLNQSKDEFNLSQMYVHNKITNEISDQSESSDDEKNIEKIRKFNLTHFFGYAQYLEQVGLYEVFEIENIPNKHDQIEFQAKKSLYTSAKMLIAKDKTSGILLNKQGSSKNLKDLEPIKQNTSVSIHNLEQEMDTEKYDYHIQDPGAIIKVLIRRPKQLNPLNGKEILEHPNKLFRFQNEDFKKQQVQDQAREIQSGSNLLRKSSTLKTVIQSKKLIDNIDSSQDNKSFVTEEDLELEGNEKNFEIKRSSSSKSFKVKREVNQFSLVRGSFGVPEDQRPPETESPPTNSKLPIASLETIVEDQVDDEHSDKGSVLASSHNSIMKMNNMRQAQKNITIIRTNFNSQGSIKNFPTSGSNISPDMRSQFSNPKDQNLKLEKIQSQAQNHLALINNFYKVQSDHSDDDRFDNQSQQVAKPQRQSFNSKKRDRRPSINKTSEKMAQIAKVDYNIEEIKKQLAYDEKINKLICNKVKQRRKETIAKVQRRKSIKKLSKRNKTNVFSPIIGRIKTKTSDVLILPHIQIQPKIVNAAEQGYNLDSDEKLDSLSSLQSAYSLNDSILSEKQFNIYSSDSEQKIVKKVPQVIEPKSPLANTKIVLSDHSDQDQETEEVRKLKLKEEEQERIRNQNLLKLQNKLNRRSQKLKKLMIQKPIQYFSKANQEILQQNIKEKDEQLNKINRFKTHFGGNSSKDVVPAKKILKGKFSLKDKLKSTASNIMKTTTKIRQLEAPAEELRKREKSQQQVKEIAEAMLRSEQTRLIEAIENNCSQRVQQFIQYHVRYINNHFEDGNTPLTLAVQNGKSSIVEKLLEQGQASPNIVTKDEGNTPLHFAVQYKSKKIQDLLIEAGADESIKNFDGLLPWEGTVKKYSDN